MTREEGALAALKALPHAIAVFDAGDRLVIGNTAFWATAGAEASRFPPGTPLRDVVRLLAFRGLLAGDEFGGCFCAVWTSFGEDL